MTSAMAAVAAIRKRTCSVTELTERFLSRIDQYNPRNHALRESDAEQARLRARDLDARLHRGEDIGLLGGLPVLVKENCDTKGYACSAGLSFRSDHRPGTDSWVTDRLRRAGAVILGTSISDPGAFGVRTAEVTHPMEGSLTVGGSSGGSAAALASGLCLGAIGTDTGGSIRIPSACCGTVGLKPTFAALPMDGVFPLVPSLDHVGPMARSCVDTALLWSGLSELPVSEPQSVKRIGYDPAWIAEADAPIRAAFSGLFDRLAKAGLKLHEVALPEIGGIWDVHGTVFMVESAAWHLARFNEQRDRYPKLAQDGFALAEAMGVKTYLEACRQRVLARHQVTALFDGIDVILVPTLCVHLPAKHAQTLMIDGKAMDYVMALVRQTSLFNLTGHPSLAMPFPDSAGQVRPSLQIVGRHGAEDRLMSFGHWLECGQGR